MKVFVAGITSFLPVLAGLLGAKRPMHVPAWLARPAAGKTGVAVMTEQRGATNAKAKRGLGWTRAHPSWRTGFAADFGGATR
jgi:2-alkyl-3-oxoalkanoate reductase